MGLVSGLSQATEESLAQAMAPRARGGGVSLGSCPRPLIGCCPQ